jgi:hypothetical protein
VDKQELSEIVDGKHISPPERERELALAARRLAFRVFICTK